MCCPPRQHMCCLGRQDMCCLGRKDVCCLGRQDMCCLGRQEPCSLGRQDMSSWSGRRGSSIQEEVALPDSDINATPKVTFQVAFSSTVQRVARQTFCQLPITNATQKATFQVAFFLNNRTKSDPTQSGFCDFEGVPNSLHKSVKF